MTFAGILDSGGGIQSNKSSGYAFYSPSTYSQFHGVVSDLGLNNLSIQSASGIACGYDTSSGFFIKTDPAGPHSGAALKVINGYDDGTSHQEGYFSGPGVNIGTGPVTAGSYNIWDGSHFFGGISGTLAGTFTWDGFPATTMVVKGGVVVQVT